jgi:PKD domain-containing protein/dockerin type I repeat protein/cellulase (glycosyl hydrolase family 5)
MAAAASSPVLYGWGGILAVGAVHYNSGNPSSTVFPGEQASNTEVTFAEMNARGYNAARVSIIDPGNQPDSGSYDSNAWHRTLALARYYGLWVIGDDHEYDCPSTTFWQPVFQDTPQSTYPDVVWEPKNEPHCSTLATDDQSVIDLARNSGDTRWFVLGCDSDCSPGGGGSDLGGFPVVTDSQNHIFYDFHEYYFYSAHSSSWSVSDAISWADSKWAGVQDVISMLHRPFLGTEWGAETGCSTCAPDQAVPGSAGYAPETLAYVTELVKLSQKAGVGYTIWNAGDWNDPPAGTTGALDTFGQYLPLPSASTALSASFTISPQSPLAGQSAMFTGSATAGTGPYTFSWSFGDGSTGSGANVTHVFGSTGSYNVTLTVVDSLSVSSSVSELVTVSSPAVTCTMADFNGDGKVTILDVSVFALHFGASTGSSLYDARFDLNHDGTINILDLALLALVYGQTC